MSVPASMREPKPCDRSGATDPQMSVIERETSTMARRVSAMPSEMGAASKTAAAAGPCSVRSDTRHGEHRHAEQNIEATDDAHSPLACSVRLARWKLQADLSGLSAFGDLLVVRRDLPHGALRLGVRDVLRHHTRVLRTIKPVFRASVPVGHRRSVLSRPEVTRLAKFCFDK